MIQSTKRFFFAAAPLFLVIFIDSMGLGLVFPILNALVFDPHTHFIAATMSDNTRNLLYGFTIGIYMFCWFFGAALLGDVSDQIGRKKSLMICLLGAFVGYFISAIAVVFSSYSLLLLGRVIAGFTAGSQAIAQAAIVDLSESEHKARNLGLILFFSSLGFVFGPIVGGFLSNANLVSWFNYSLPFYFASAISLLNALLLYGLFKESFTSVAKLSLKFHSAIMIFVSAFTHEKIRKLSLILLVMIFGWSGIYSFISMYLLRVYQFSSMQNGFYMGLMGVGFGIGTGILVDPLTRRFSLKQCMIVSCIIVTILCLLTVTAPQQIYIWFYVVLLGCAMALAYSAILTLFSNQVDEDSQGWIMGITGSIMAFAFGINGFLTGALASFSPATPIIIAALCLLISACMMHKMFEPAVAANPVAN